MLPSYSSRLKLSAFVTEILATLGNRIMVMALGLITTVVVARYLGPEGRGLFAVASLVTSLGVQFGNLGLHAANTYEIAKDPDRLSVLIGNSLITGFGFGALFAVITISMYWMFPQIVSIGGTLLWLAVAGIPVGITYLLLQNLLLGLYRIKEFNIVELASKLVAAILIGAALYSGLRTPEWIAAATLVSIIVGLLNCLILLKPAIDKISSSLAQFNSSIYFGTKAYLAALFAFLQQKIALLLVQNDFGAIDSGYFSVAMALFDLAFIVPATVGTILFPRLSAINDPKERRVLAYKVFWRVAVGMIAIAIIAYLLSGFAIQILFGEAFLPAENYFRLLLPGLVFLSMSSMLMNYLGSAGMPITVVYVPALAFLGMLLTYYAGVTKLGAQSAAVANSVGHFLSLLILAIFFYCNKQFTNRK